ncbi:MAG: L,D-transpeptidase family protein [Pseudomonadota bacterium]|nr:L,D-transpeptidase family protein [Pseudomonadota bacterium]
MTWTTYRFAKGTGANCVSRRACAALAAALLLVPAWSPVVQADSNWWRPSFMRDDSSSRQEDRARREQVRNELQQRFEPLGKNTIAYVSKEMIERLRGGIEKYRAIVQAGGWGQLSEGRTLRINDTGEDIRILRHRLVMTGDMLDSGRRSWAFDSEMQDGVARFQTRHGLRVTGVVDARTRAALNVPAQHRLRQLELNMQRIYDLSEISSAEKYVLVNAPGYTLQAVEKSGLAFESGVIVGRPDRQTPEVSAKIIELNFYPFWRVPDSISSKDLIPAIRKDINYFYKEHFSVLPTWGAKPFDPQAVNWNSDAVYNYKFRQDPGPHNALGLVRINMPNKHTVYLHDTPLKHLFAQSSRAFSSGCVRVERVFDLAGWLVEGQDDWGPMKVQTVLAAGQAEDVKLKKPVPVHFVYLTAWVADSGAPNFRPDIYGKDGAAEAGADDEAAPNDARSITP